MEKNKERNEVLTQMTHQLDKVGQSLSKMLEQDDTGELDPQLFADYRKEQAAFTELDNRLRDLTADIDHGDKSDVQSQPTPGGNSPTSSSY